MLLRAKYKVKIALALNVKNSIYKKVTLVIITLDQMYKHPRTTRESV